jgi:hypothetical protein
MKLSSVADVMRANQVARETRLDVVSIGSPKRRREKDFSMDLASLQFTPMQSTEGKKMRRSKVKKSTRDSVLFDMEFSPFADVSKVLSPRPTRKNRIKVDEDVLQSLRITSAVKKSRDARLLQSQDNPYL